MQPRRTDERGLAMVMTVVVMLVAASLAAVILVQGSNTDRNSGRSRNWDESLQAADAGVEHAIALLQADNGAVPVTQPVTATTADGAYSFTVQKLPRGRYQIDSVGTAGTAQGLTGERHIRAILAPPISFKYALFSLGDVTTKNVNNVEGDIWANGSVTIEQNDTVTGHVIAATGWLTMQNGSRITGDVQTGGVDGDGVAMYVENVGGNVKASSTVPGCTDAVAQDKYKIEVSGTDPGVGGNAITAGHNVNFITGNVAGTKAVMCTLAPLPKPMPTLNFDPTLYDPVPDMFTSVAAFQSFLNGLPGGQIEGVYYVTGPGTVDLNGLTIVGDTTIIAEQDTNGDAPRIWSNGIDADTGGQDTLFILVSEYVAQPGDQCTSTDSSSGNPEDCAIGLKNNFDPSADNIAALVYAPFGPVAFKNTSDFNGAVYGTNIVLKNNLDITYDGRVDRVLGFGPVTYERESWVERSD